MSKLPPHLQHLYDTKQYAALESELEELAGEAFASGDWDAHDRIMKQLRAVHKLIVPLFALCLLFASCEPSEPSRGGDTTTSHQPSNPSAWSPVGKTYICETTWENSPASDRYWAWVIKFYSEGEVVEYETPNRDLSYHPDYLHIIDSTIYTINYPTLTYYSLAGGTVPMVFKDTLTLRFDANDVTYTLLR